jgi:hypothetical protein
MDKHYYLVSQLPILFFDRELPVSIKWFLQEAEKWLRVREYRFLLSVDINDFHIDDKGPSVWQEFKKFENLFRNDLVAWRRSLHTDMEYKPSTFPISMVKEGNPLDVEKKLLKYRWKVLEEMELDHHFDLGFLVLYYLKLQILRRLSLFDKESGMGVFQQITNETRPEEDTNHDKQIN